jgi:hypothetical protein
MRRATAAILYLASAVYALVTLWRFPPWTVDDAYIVFRYARNLVEHGQLTWNLGAPPVEGYTGVALPLLVAAGMRAGIAPAVFARGLGCVALFVTAGTVWDNQRRLGVPEPARAYVTASVLLFSPFYVHATSGLETVPFLALVGISFGTLLACDADPRPGRQARLWLSLLVLSLLRPEGLAFAATFGVALAVRVVRGGASRRVAGAFAGALYAVPYGTYFAWRVAYYGRLWPNTFYAKAATQRADVARYASGFFETSAALAGAWMPLLLVAAILALLLPSPRRLPRAPIAAALGATGVLAAQYARSFLVMGYYYRFEIQAFFVLLPLLGVLLARLERLRGLRSRTGAGTAGAIAVLCAASLVAWPIECLRDAPDARWHAQRYLDTGTEQQARLGALLRDRLPASEPIACWVDAGVIPFVADDHIAIDFGRLNDAYLARPGVSRAMVADYFFARRPGALIVTSDSPTELVPEHDAEIVIDDPRFAEYERALTLCSPRYPEAPCEVLFLRRGVELL